jgi:integrase
MSARKMGNSWRVDITFRGKRYRKISPENTRSGALAYEVVLRNMLTRGEDIDAPQQKEESFIDFANEWLNTYAKPNNKASELRAKKLIMRKHLIPAFGNLPLTKIQSGEIERYKARKIDQSLHPKTINNHITVLRRCLRSAQEWGRIERIPFMKLMRVPPSEMGFLSEDEERVFLDAAQNELSRLMYITALNTGMRMGELLGLDWSAVDFQRKSICVRQSIVRGVFGTPKSNRVRFIPLTDTLAALLWGKREREGLVFGRKDGSPLSDSALKKMIWNTCDRAGMKRFGWHRFRHTFASRLVSREVPLRAVQQLLGHASIQMTERYAHLAPTVLTDAIRVLENTYQNKSKALYGHSSISFTVLEGENQEKNLQKTP